MKKPIHAILIDPFTQTVLPVVHDAADYKHLYTLLSTKQHPVDLFTVAYPDFGNESEDAIFVDDEGLLKGPTDFFTLPGTTPLAGRGIILGTDEEGDSITPTVGIDWVRDNVRFLGHGEVQL